jgi:carbamoyltransferase
MQENNQLKIQLVHGYRCFLESASNFIINNDLPPMLYGLKSYLESSNLEVFLVNAYDWDGSASGSTFTILYTDSINSVSNLSFQTEDHRILAFGGFYDEESEDLLKRGVESVIYQFDPDSLLLLINTLSIPFNPFVAACQEEVFSRIKHDSSFPYEAIEYCLKEARINLSDIDTVVFFERSDRVFSRLMETYQIYAPKGVESFIRNVPNWVLRKLYLKKNIFRKLTFIDPKLKREEIQILTGDHQLSHAASTFYPSPFEEAAILVTDNIGEWETTSIGIGKGQNISFLKEQKYPHSLGLFYSATASFLGFQVNEGEYKLMGLAPFGNKPKALQIKKLLSPKIIQIFEDGSIWLNQKWFLYTTRAKLISRKKWSKHLNIPSRNKEDKILQEHCDFALSVQLIIEEVMINLAKETKQLTGAKYLCMGGFMALNGAANGKIWNLGLFEDIFIQPAATDAGGALGAALSIAHMGYNTPRKINPRYSSFLGPGYDRQTIRDILVREKIVFEEIEEEEKLYQLTAEFVADSYVVGWFQGRMEFGPMTLGHRSILADPRDPEIQYIVNENVKLRESYRPFGCVVLEEEVNDYFDFKHRSPTMLNIQKINSNWIREIPTEFHSWDIERKLSYYKSSLAAITHVDLTARIQTLGETDDHKLRSVLKHFKKITGFGVILNTRLNEHDNCIAGTPIDAIKIFRETQMDILIMENFIIKKENQ